MARVLLTRSLLSFVFTSLAVLALVGGGGVASASPVGAWTEHAPPDRSNAQAFVDTEGDRLVMIGSGGTGASPGDLWSLSLSKGTWTRIDTPDGAPEPREYASLAWDASTRSAYYFGGQLFSGELSGLWRLDLNGAPTWTLLEPQGAWPDERMLASLMMDPARRRLLLYGGVRDQGQPLEGVWAFGLDGTPRWQRLTPTGTPPPAHESAMATYDTVNDRMLVFVAAPENSSVTAVWQLEFSGSSEPVWSRLLTSYTPPSPRLAAFLTYDAVRQRVWYGNGSVSLRSPAFSDLWRLELHPSAHWVEASSAGLRARVGAASTWDADGDRMIVVAGQTQPESYGVPMSDAWAWPGSGTPEYWTQLDLPLERPISRFGHATAYQPGADRYWIFGGYWIGDPSGIRAGDDVWTRSLDEDAMWTRIVPENQGPTARYVTAGAYDPIGRRFLIFGGADLSGGGWMSDTWGLSVDSPHVWTLLHDGVSSASSGPAPSPRLDHAVTYDPVRHRLVVFAGLGGGDDEFADLWALELGDTPPTWTLLAAAVPGAPSKRRWPSLDYDPVRDRLISYGGLDETGTLDETWVFDLRGNTGWSRLEVPGPGPMGRHRHSTAYDPIGNRILLTGGRSESADSFGPTRLWSMELSGDSPRWTMPPVSGSPGRNPDAPSLVFDPVRNVLHTALGLESFGTRTGSWQLAFDHSVSVGAWLAGASTGAGSARLSWYVTVPSGTVLRLDRAPASYGLWEPVLSAAQSAFGTVLTFEDPNAGAGTSWRYQLVRASDGVVMGGPVVVDVPNSPVLALLGATPNPTHGATRVTFNAIRAGEIAFRMFDVRGRLTWSDKRTIDRAGTMTLSLELLENVPAGVHFLTIEQDGQRAERKIVVMR